jgi:hypothetical protein
VLNCLGNPQPFFPESPALGERAQLSMAKGEVLTGKHGREVWQAETFMAPRPFEERHSMGEAIDPATIVTLYLVNLAEA